MLWNDLSGPIARLSFEWQVVGVRWELPLRDSWQLTLMYVSSTSRLMFVIDTAPRVEWLAASGDVPRPPPPPPFFFFGFFFPINLPFFFQPFPSCFPLEIVRDDRPQKPSISSRKTAIAQLENTVSITSISFYLQVNDPWGFSTTSEKALLWNCSETALILLWNCSETALLGNCSGTALKLLWNGPGTV